MGVGVVVVVIGGGVGRGWASHRAPISREGRCGGEDGDDGRPSPRQPRTSASYSPLRVLLAELAHDLEVLRHGLGLACVFRLGVERERGSLASRRRPCRRPRSRRSPPLATHSRDPRARRMLGDPRPKKGALRPDAAAERRPRASGLGEGQDDGQGAGALGRPPWQAEEEEEPSRSHRGNLGALEVPTTRASMRVRAITRSRTCAHDDGGAPGRAPHRGGGRARRGGRGGGGEAHRRPHRVERCFWGGVFGRCDVRLLEGGRVGLDGGKVVPGLRASGAECVF